MDKKNILLLIAAILVGVLIFVGSIFLLLNGTQKPSEVTPTVPEATLPDFGGDVTVPEKEVNKQVDEIDKLGFENLSGYWVDKLKEVCDLPAELNKGQTLEDLCEYYFREEYKAYQEAMLLGDEKLEEYPEDKTDALYEELVTLGVNGFYLEITERIDELMKEYKFTLPYNYKIGDLYYDAMLLLDIDDMSKATRVKTIGKLKTPELQLAAAVKQSAAEQCAMFANTDSVCFEYGTHINIISVERYTIDVNTEDFHEKKMNLYYNFYQADLPVVKVQFTIDYEQSPMDIYSFNNYFKLDDSAHYLYDKNGNKLFNMDYYSDEELKAIIVNYSDYAEEINAELQRRKDAKNNSSQTNAGTIDGEFSGTAGPDEIAPDINEYDTKLFERYQQTVYEAYIPEYSLPKNTYNRIYLIVPINNLDINCLKTIEFKRSTFTSNEDAFTFIYQNQWSRQESFDEDFANSLIGQGTPD